jgi:hypothetical protein
MAAMADAELDPVDMHLHTMTSCVSAVSPSSVGSCSRRAESWHLVLMCDDMAIGYDPPVARASPEWVNAGISPESPFATGLETTESSE